ncbi:MAG: hypothetical protein HRT88_18710, partial [Lentisphaeraceae bacterium]|nr:hypothetical protein [Lentisphaeraceae bacterium]
MYLKKIVSLLLLLGLNGSLFSASSSPKFRDGLTPSSIVGKKVSKDTKYFQHGKDSLKWDFTPGAELKLSFLKLDPKINHVKFWVYSETPQTGKLKVSLNTALDTYSIGLNFKNWRAFYIRFKDLKKPKSADKQVTITAPGHKGTLWLDSFNFLKELKNLEGDSNIPFNNEHGQDNGSWYWRSSYVKPEIGSAVSAENKKAFAKMRERYLEVFANYSESKDYVKKHDLDDAIEVYNELLEKYKIKRIDGHVSGLPLAKSTGRKEVSSLLLWYAQKWRRNPSKEAAEKALLILDYFVERGYCDDSSRGYPGHHYYSLSQMGPAMALLRPLLIERGRLDEIVKGQVWMSTLERIFEPLTPGSKHNPSYTSMRMMLGALMIMDDADPVKEMYIKRYLAWHEANAVPTILTGHRNPDFTQFFHSRHSSGYYVIDFIHLGKMLYTLQCPEFKIPDRIMHNYKMKYLISEFTHCDTSPSMATVNRIPFSYIWGLHGRLQGGSGKSNFKDLDLFPSTNTGNAYALGLVKFDDNSQEMLQGSLHRWSKSLDPKLFDMDTLKLFENQTPKDAPTGFLPLPFSNLSTFRRENWMVSLAGYNKYIPSGEYGGGSAHARYFFNGCMWIQSKGDPAVSQEGSGYEVEGFDYNHIPGTSAIVLGPDELKAESGFIYGEESFSGGVHLNGQQGIFSTIISGNPDPTFKARKSFFCFGDRIICMGTGISNENKLESHTTLFQVNLSQGNKSDYLDGAVVDQIPFQKNNVNEQASVIIDSKSNGFYIYPNHRIHLERKNNKTMGKMPKGSK